MLQVSPPSQGWVNCSASECVWVIISSEPFNNSTWLCNNHKDIAERIGALALTVRLFHFLFVSAYSKAGLWMLLRTCLDSSGSSLPQWDQWICSPLEDTAYFFLSLVLVVSLLILYVWHRDTLKKNHFAFSGYNTDPAFSRMQTLYCATQLFSVCIYTNRWEMQMPGGDLLWI